MERVSFAWRNRLVLDDIDLCVGPGTVTALRGDNGAGKTTLIHLLGGRLQPLSGRIALRELDAVANRREYLRRIGAAGAGDRGLYARLDVRAHLRLAAALALVPRAREHDLIAASLEQFALRPLARSRVDRLSTGQRQRVRLAIAFLHQPDVVLLDEPTSSLDEDGAALLAGALEGLTGRGACAVLAAPSGTQAGLPIDRTYAVVAGRLELDG